MSAEELRHICWLTLELTKLRQAECKHVCVESLAPEIFERLLKAYEQRQEKR